MSVTNFLSGFIFHQNSESFNSCTKQTVENCEEQTVSFWKNIYFCVSCVQLHSHDAMIGLFYQGTYWFRASDVPDHPPTGVEEGGTHLQTKQKEQTDIS